MSAKNFKVFLQGHSGWGQGGWPPGEKSVGIIWKFISLSEIFIACYDETFKIMSEKFLKSVSSNHSSTILHK